MKNYGMTAPAMLTFGLAALGGAAQAKEPVTTDLPNAASTRPAEALGQVTPSGRDTEQQCLVGSVGRQCSTSTSTAACRICSLIRNLRRQTSQAEARSGNVSAVSTSAPGG